ncbi:MAG: hypothetical protein BGO09_08155 [Bacteroidetes bacterium 47-18]|nr:MAG: hypothetical protein BGO09_08155 [Bacteroidetes bacterium 47-18]
MLLRQSFKIYVNGNRCFFYLGWIKDKGLVFCYGQRLEFPQIMSSCLRVSPAAAWPEEVCKLLNRVNPFLVKFKYHFGWYSCQQADTVPFVQLLVARILEATVRAMGIFIKRGWNIFADNIQGVV